MAKQFPSEEFKTAVKALNVILKENEKDPIKFVGIKKIDVVENFTNVIIDFIKQDMTEKLPDEVINFYNKYIANTDEEEGTDDTEVPAPAPDDVKKKKKTKNQKESKPKKARATGTDAKSRMIYMASLIDKGKYTLKEVTAKTSEKFPDINIVTVETNLRDARNEKNKKYEKLVLMDKETKILSWDK